MNQLINPDMFILARDSRGKTQTELSEFLEIPQSSISKIEQGLLSPSEEILDKIANTLEYPITFFYEKAEICTPQSIQYRKAVSGKSVLKRIEASGSIVRMALNKLMKELGDTSTHPLLKKDFSDLNPKEIALQVRAALNIGRGPIENISHIIEQLGIVIFPFDFGTDRIDGFYLSNDFELPPIIFINKDIPGDRMRFTLAHELGHILMHKVSLEEEQTMEKEANAFASEFLIPLESIQHELNILTLKKLGELKTFWKTSMAAILFKAPESPRKKYLWISMSRYGYTKKEPLEFPQETVNKVNLLFKKFSVNSGALSNFFHISSKDVLQLFQYAVPSLEISFL